MSIPIANVQAFTDADLLVLYRKAAADLALSQMITINGRSVTRAQLPQIRDMIAWLESRIQIDANGAAGNSALVQFGEAR